MERYTMTSSEFSGLASEILRRGSDLRFRATGFSMTPRIRNGDCITISPASAASIRRGDVAVYLAEADRLVAHRVWTRCRSLVGLTPDAGTGLVARVPDNRIVGRATRIERGNRQIRPDSRLSRHAAIAGISASRILRRIVRRTGAALSSMLRARP